MPRYEDSHGTRLYVGHLSSRTRSRDLEHIFSRYGRVRDVDMKRDYAFVEFSDPRDADDARYKLDGKDVDGRRIAVEFARGVPRGSRGGARDYGGRGPAPGTGCCFNCGIEGHWARDCKSGDWKNKCYRCGERGHVERDCRDSPKKLRRGRSYSRSPVRSRSPHRGRSRSRSFSPTRSYSRSRSPPPRRGKDIEHQERRSRSPQERSPKLKTRNHSPSPDNSPKRASPSPSIGKTGIDENNRAHSNSTGSPDRVVDENDIGYPRNSESPPSRGVDENGGAGHTNSE